MNPKEIKKRQNSPHILKTKILMPKENHETEKGRKKRKGRKRPTKEEKRKESKEQQQKTKISFRGKERQK